MMKLLAGAFAGTVALVLLTAFAGHLRRPRALPAALTAHRTVPRPLIWPVAVASVALEGLLGAVTGYAVLDGRAHLLTLAAGGCAVLLGGYALYGLYVLRTRPGVPCGCAAEGTPMSVWVAARAAALALAALTAAAGAGQAVTAHGADAVIATLASIVFAASLWSLPLAMADPERNLAG
jgi:hypothetical protein